MTYFLMIKCENHWENFYKNITQKTKDWEYENEYRIIYNELMCEKKDDLFKLQLFVFKRYYL